MRVKKRGVAIRKRAVVAVGLTVGIGLAATISAGAIELPLSGPGKAELPAVSAPAEKPAAVTDLLKPGRYGASSEATDAPTAKSPAEPTEQPTKAPLEIAEPAPTTAPAPEPTAENTAEPETTARPEPTTAAPAPEPQRAAPTAPAKPAPAPTVAAAGGVQDSFDQRMAAIINAERAAAGVAPLKYWGGLRAGALAHSGWMNSTGAFQHASDGTMDADTAAGGCSGGWAENIYWASDTAASPESAMAAYMDSPGHRANILHPDLRFVATGTIATDNGLYNTQRFSFSCD
ncbi:hypothetical protein FE374_14950 [Georgenia yuyongxinii]|uniref:SCP domain-containing protein n=1 Tax=Georgenia yuyongxinii TaxID=2589797 RepID=A0A5B8C8M7_9MICO|nr:CAP domain-containing protein [Georgenia yuyongxinii]QDC25735.1 hypothetical protein FE374_14950 [Georgenia yuyongxinii]